MPGKINPAAIASNPSMVLDQLVEVEKLPIKRTEERKQRVIDEQKQFTELRNLVNDLGGSLNSFRTARDFNRLKIESSHPDIIDGSVTSEAVPGAYELEVRQIAKTHKLMADSFPDKDKTSVGFGYMTVESEDGGVFDVDIDPDHSTLQEVANQINNLKAGVKAIIINTKENLENPDEEAYRLLVISEKSGKQARVYVDPDTTYLDFKEQVSGRNLHLLFEDVPVFDSDNVVEELMTGVVLNAKRAEPGTKVNVTIGFDIDKTLEGIKGFVEKYNKLNEFIEKQTKVDPETQKAGVLSKDNTLRTLRRQLQGVVAQELPGRYHSLAQVGITSEPKSGALKVDDTKLKQALSEDYEAVAKLFVQSDQGSGFGYRMSEAVRNLQGSQAGVIPSKEREYRRILQTFDSEIERKNRMTEQRVDGLKRKFSALESLMGGLNSQQQYIQARLGNAGG